MLDPSPKSLLLKPISTALLGQELSPLQAKRPEAKPRARGNAPPLKLSKDALDRSLLQTCELGTWKLKI